MTTAPHPMLRPGSPEFRALPSKTQDTTRIALETSDRYGGSRYVEIEGVADTHSVALGSYAGGGKGYFKSPHPGINIWTHENYRKPWTFRAHVPEAALDEIRAHLVCSDEDLRSWNAALKKFREKYDREARAHAAKFRVGGLPEPEIEQELARFAKRYGDTSPDKEFCDNFGDRREGRPPILELKVIGFGEPILTFEEQQRALMKENALIQAEANAEANRANLELHRALVDEFRAAEQRRREEDAKRDARFLEMGEQMAKAIAMLAKAHTKGSP